MDIPARVTVLQRVPLFQGLSTADLATVAREAH